MKVETFLNTVILTSIVFAALVTSIANIIISLLNNRRLKKMENRKQMNEIDKYRYSRLYELILNWHRYDAEQIEGTASKIAFYKLLNLFIDDSRRYELARPLLDECYIKNLEIKKEKCENLLNALINEEAPDGTHSKEFPIIKEKYFENGTEFSKMLKNAINTQLETLLRKNNLNK